MNSGVMSKEYKQLVKAFVTYTFGFWHIQ